MYTIDELANLLRVSRITILRKVYNGNIKAVKIGKSWRISSEEVERLLTKGTK